MRTSLTYTLYGGRFRALFGRRDRSDQRIGAGTSLDYENSGRRPTGTTTYELTLNVKDGKDRQGNDDTSVDDSVDVTIRVTNVNEPPRVWQFDT